MALGVEAAGLQSKTLQAALPSTTHQIVVDVAVAGGGDKRQPIRVIDSQRLYPLIVLSQHLQLLYGQWHNPLSPCLRGSPAVMT